MSKIAFVITREPHIAFGQVGLEIMAAILKSKGHKVIGIADSTFDPNPRMTRDEEKNLKILEDFDPDFVGVCSLTHRYQWNLKFSRLVKKILSDTKIVFGGPHPTVLPNIVSKEDCVDYVCVGEGEGAMLELANDPNRKGILNIYPNPLRPLITDLDSLPFPDKTIWLETGFDKSIFKTYLCMAARGCPWNCSFCFNSAKHKVNQGLGPWLRYRSVDNVISELEMAKKQYPVEFVLFQEDNFAYNKEWMREFAVKYTEKIDVPYSGNTHPIIIDEEMASLLKKSGCSFIILGMQTGNDDVRQNVVGRPETNDVIRRAAKNLHNVDLKFVIDHLFGLPKGDTIEILDESVRLYNEIRPFTINTYRLYVLPKTLIVDQLSLSEDYIHKMEQGQHQEATIRATKDPTYVSYRNLMVFIPLLPKWLVEKILSSKILLNFIGKSPEFFIWFTKGINNLRGGNSFLVKEYVSSLPKFVFQRIKGYKGEFEVPVTK